MQDVLRDKSEKVRLLGARGD